MAELRRYCLCGGAVTASSTLPSMAQGVVEAFDTFHQGLGHGPATAAQARAARRKNEALEVARASDS